MDSLILWPADMPDGTLGVRLYCPRCEVDLGRWPSLDLRHAQHEASLHTVHGREMLREANQREVAEALLLKRRIDALSRNFSSSFTGNHSIICCRLCDWSVQGYDLAREPLEQKALQHLASDHSTL